MGSPWLGAPFRQRRRHAGGPRQTPPSSATPAPPRARTLRTEVEVAGVVALLATLELAIRFHHVVLGDTEHLATGLAEAYAGFARVRYSAFCSSRCVRGG